MKIENFKNKTWLSKKRLLSLICILTLCFSSCKKEITESKVISNIPKGIIEKLKAAGFDLSEGLTEYKNGYLVEGDIFFTEKDIKNLDINSKVDVSFQKPESSSDRSGGTKDPTSHYVTNNLLSFTSSRRTIQIYMDPTFGSYLQNCLDSAINRYNALDLSLIFSRTTNSSNANISIVATYVDPNIPNNPDFLMYAGFPSGGNPYNQIVINTFFYNSSFNRNDAITTIAHEIGHTIGFRHTDYMNRAFSCGVVRPDNNEGVTSIGANHVIGTPGPPDIYTPGSFNSWMLACSSGDDRQFTEADIISLKEIYSYRKNIYVKQNYTFVSDESGSIYGDDFERVTWDIDVEFFQDAGLTIPYVTANNFMLNVWYGSIESNLETRLLIPNGVTSYNLGIHLVDRYYTYGNLVSDNSTGYRLKNGVAYYGPY